MRRDNSIRIPDPICEALNLNPQTKVTVRMEGTRVIIEKVALADDPFAKAAEGPDVSALDRIQKEQQAQKEKARDRFEELIKNPPEVKPEDNPDLWR